MAKLTLHLETLEVESFPTEQEDRALRGTVRAHDASEAAACGPTNDQYCSQFVWCIEEPSMGCPASEYTCTVIPTRCGT